MNWGFFFRVIIVAFFIFSFAASCANSQDEKVSIEELSRAIKEDLSTSNDYKALGYFKLKTKFALKKIKHR